MGSDKIPLAGVFLLRGFRLRILLGCFGFVLLLLTMISARLLLWALLAFLVFGALAFLAITVLACRWLTPKRISSEIKPVRPIHRP